jgi:hypothetical protein
MSWLGRPIRVRFRDKIKSLLMGQVIFNLAGRGRSPSPTAGVPCAPPTLAAATTLGMNNTRGYCSTTGTVALQP